MATFTYIHNAKSIEITNSVTKEGTEYKHLLISSDDGWHEICIFMAKNEEREEEWVVF